MWIISVTQFHKINGIMKNLLNSVVSWVRGFVGNVGRFLASVAWVYKILACVKRKTKGVSGVGRNFGVDGVSLKCFF